MIQSGNTTSGVTLPTYLLLYKIRHVKLYQKINAQLCGVTKSYVQLMYKVSKYRCLYTMYLSTVVFLSFLQSPPRVGGVQCDTC